MKTLTAILLCFSMTLLACSKSSPSKDTPSGSAKRIPAGRPELLKPGQKATIDDIEITILSARTTDQYTNSPSEGKKYIVLRFKVKNLSGEEKLYCRGQSANLQWIDPKEGRRYGTEFGVPCNNPEKDSLAPGAEGEFEAAYMIPKEYSEAEFHYAAMDPMEKARWLVPVK